MGRRGPKPKPKTNLSYRSDRHGAQAPNPVAGWPVMPSDLTVEQRKVWNEVKRTMEETTVIRKADRQALVIYCQLIARYRELSAYLDAFGMIDEDTGKPHAVHALIRDLLGQIRQWARELGLTPSSRTTLHDPSTPVDPASDEFNL